MHDWTKQLYLFNTTSTSGYEVLTPTTFTGLGAGSHTLRILRREDGALLDKVILTASAGTISADGSNPTPESTDDPDPGTPVTLQAESYSNMSGINVYGSFIGSCDDRHPRSQVQVE